MGVLSAGFALDERVRAPSDSRENPDSESGRTLMARVLVGDSLLLTRRRRSPVTEATRRRHEHEVLQEHVGHIRLAAREIPTLSLEERRLLISHMIDFLEGTLLPLAEREERTLYPAIAGLLGHSQSTATMVRDHEAIRERVALLELAAPEDVARIQELLYGLHALISVHFWKEEVEYLPLLEWKELAAYVCEPSLAG
jgi:hypothetical protein